MLYSKIFKTLFTIIRWPSKYTDDLAGFLEPKITRLYTPALHKIVMVHKVIID